MCKVSCSASSAKSGADELEHVNLFATFGGGSRIGAISSVAEQLTWKYRILLLFLAVVSGCTAENASIVETTGTIEATQVDIRSEVAGRILKLFVNEGDIVKPGDILAIVDHEKLTFEVQKAEAQAHESQAKLELLQNGYRKEDVQKAQAAMQEAEIFLKNVEKEYVRIKQLHANKIVSESTKDTYATNYKTALTRYEQARQEYYLMQSGYRAEDVAAGKALKESADASVLQANRSIQDATIRSPCKGIISERYVESGELDCAGSILVSITDLENVWVKCYVSEKYLSKLKIGQSSIISVDVLHGQRTFSGKVIFISPEAEFTPKNIQTKDERVKLVYGVKVQLENARERLKPGMPASVVIAAVEPHEISL